MVHMMLVKVQVPANATIFYGVLLQVAAFDFVPTDEIYMYLFKIDDTPISTNFNMLGYETLQFLYNSGSLSLFFIFFVPFMVIVKLCEELPFDCFLSMSRKIF